MFNTKQYFKTIFLSKRLLNTRLWTERRKKRTNGERRRARCAEEQGARTNLGGKKKEGTKIISDGKHRIFKNRYRV